MEERSYISAMEIARKPYSVFVNPIECGCVVNYRVSYNPSYESKHPIFDTLDENWLYVILHSKQGTFEEFSFFFKDRKSYLFTTKNLTNQDEISEVRKRFELMNLAVREDILKQLPYDLSCLIRETFSLQDLTT